MNNEEIVEYLYNLQEVAIKDRATANQSEDMLIEKVVKWVDNFITDPEFLIQVCKLAIERNNWDAVIEIASNAKRFAGLSDEYWVKFCKLSRKVTNWDEKPNPVNVASCYLADNHKHYWSIYPNRYIILSGKKFIGIADSYEEGYNIATNEYSLSLGDFMITQIEDPRIKYVAQERPPNIIKIIED